MWSFSRILWVFFVSLSNKESHEEAHYFLFATSSISIEPREQEHVTTHTIKLGDPPTNRWTISSYQWIIHSNLQFVLISEVHVCRLFPPRHRCSVLYLFSFQASTELQMLRTESLVEQKWNNNNRKSKSELRRKLSTFFVFVFLVCWHDSILSSSSFYSCSMGLTESSTERNVVAFATVGILKDDCSGLESRWSLFKSNLFLFSLILLCF